MASRPPYSWDSVLWWMAFCRNLAVLPLHLAPSGRSMRVFISANSKEMLCELGDNVVLLEISELGDNVVLLEVI
ncbi:UNVERIFIED_CONTAM: hypothetical protein K2H54_054491 [Gekko kuhli]